MNPLDPVEALAAADEWLIHQPRAGEPPTGREALGNELGLIEAAERLKARLDAATLLPLARMLAAAEGELAAMRREGLRGRAAFTARELVVLEVSTATGLGPTEVGLRLDLATGPAARTRLLTERLAAGETTMARACEILDATRALADEQVETIAQAALAPTRDGAGLSTGLFRQRLRRAIIAADADAARSRRAARARIGAHATLHADGTGTLVLTNDAEKIAAAMDRADAAARAARAAGDPRSLQQLRADYLSDTAIFAHPGPDSSFPTLGRRPAGTVWVVVPVSTALGPDDEPCELPGYGWVAAEHARAMMTADASVWTTLLADADTGAALRLNHTGYRPTAEMIAHVRAVDGVCRGPGCQIPAASCDLDHDIPWPAGDTSLENLSAKHRAHHRVKTEGIWKTRRDRVRGDIHWHTAAGRHYTTYPKDWLEAARHASPRCPHAPPRDHAGGRAGQSDGPAAPDQSPTQQAPPDDVPPF